jgi:hypothetical protein
VTLVPNQVILLPDPEPLSPVKAPAQLAAGPHPLYCTPEARKRENRSYQTARPTQLARTAPPEDVKVYTAQLDQAGNLVLPHLVTSPERFLSRHRTGMGQERQDVFDAGSEQIPFG